MANDRRRRRKHGTHGPPFETSGRHKLGHIYKQGTCWGNAPAYTHPIKTTGTSPQGEPTAPALLSFAPGHIAT